MSTDNSLIPSEYLRVKAYIETQYAEPITLEILAALVSASVPYFCTEFKRLFHISAINYLISVRLQHAVRLLQDTKMPIAEVSLAVGYADCNYFSRIFKKHFGMAPSQVRKEKQLLQSMAQPVPSNAITPWGEQFHEQWKTVFEGDFTQTALADTRFQAYWYLAGDDYESAQLYPAPERVAVEHGMLRLLPACFWTNLRWDDDLAEETRIDVVVDNRSYNELNIYLAISGDMLTGYRLHIHGYDRIDFETVRNDRWEMLYLCDVQLNPQAPQFRFSFWRSGDTFYAEVDGRRIMEYYAPFAMVGADCRTIALGRYFEGNSADFRYVRIAVRRYPQYVTTLELGRIMMRQGYVENAWQWFDRMSKELDDPTLRAEACYLAALAMPHAHAEEKSRALAAIGSDTAHPFSLPALRNLALFHASQQQLDALYVALNDLSARAPGDDTFQLVMEQLRPVLMRKPDDELHRRLQQFSRFFIRRCNVMRCKLTSLELLRGLPLLSLCCINNALTDLSPLQGMPLRQLLCAGNRITELTPLHGMPLRMLDCSDNAIADLSPLHGMPLHSLFVSNNRISSLAPLRGVPLYGLSLINNAVTDLSPLAGSPLRLLYLSANQLSDLTPLRNVPLTELSIRANPIRDLTPVRSCPLTYLDCCDTLIDDFTPLAGKALSALAIKSITGRANDAVIRNLPLRRLTFDLLAQGSFPSLREISTLRLVNQHRVEYVLSIMEPLHLALQEWESMGRRGDDRATVPLRHLATSGDGVAYLAIPYRMTWRDAEAFCRSQGGHLACPATEERVRTLMRYLNRVCDTTLQRRYHLGLICRRHAWEWTNGVPVQRNGMTLPPAPQHDDDEVAIDLRYPDGYLLSFQPDDMAHTSQYFIIEWAD